MKFTFPVWLGAIVLFGLAAACRQAAPTDSGNSAVRTNANLHANAVSREREELEKESEKVRKDLEELQKKISNANAESREMQKKIDDAQKRIDETKKRIR